MYSRIFRSRILHVFSPALPHPRTPAFYQHPTDYCLPCVKCGKSPALFPAFYTYSLPHFTQTRKYYHLHCFHDLCPRHHVSINVYTHVYVMVGVSMSVQHIMLWITHETYIHLSNFLAYLGECSSMLSNTSAFYAQNCRAQKTFRAMSRFVVIRTNIQNTNNIYTFSTFANRTTKRREYPYVSFPILVMGLL